MKDRNDEKIQSGFGLARISTRNEKDIFILKIDDLNLIFVKNPFGKRRMNHINLLKS
jgi:hypothetical protein